MPDITAPHLIRNIAIPRKSMKQFSILFIIILLSNRITAQTIEIKPSNEIIAEGIKLYDEEKYEDALKEFETISRNDSNYVYSLYETALTYSALKNYDKAIELATEGLKHKTEFDHQLYEIIATCYDEKGEFEKSITTYDQAIARFPLAYKLHFEKGVAFLKSKKYPEAEECFKKSLQMNPFHAGSHLCLGHTYKLNGYIVPAIYAYMTFLIIEPASNRSLNTLISIESISQGKDLPSPDSVTDLHINKEAYNEAELIMQSGVARDTKYKLKTKADYTATRQMQSLFEKVEYDKSNPDFWMQYYVPFFNEMHDNKYFETFTYQILQSVEGNEKLTKTIKSATSDIEKFAQWVIEDFNKKRDAYFKSISSSDNIRYIFYQSGMPKASGEYDEAKKAFSGNFQYYYPAGYISSKGKFDASAKKQGKWEYYYTSNRIKSTTIYKDDIADGEYSIYYKNGKEKERGNYLMGKAEGKMIGYYATGSKHFEGHFKNDLRDGIVSIYFRNGNLKEQTEYKAGKADGPNKTYYFTGELKDDSPYKNDLQEGLFKRYYPNGKTAIEGTFVNGLKEGEWKWYYENGTPEKNITYKADKENGKYIAYYENGNKEEEADYVNGKASGKYIDFDEDGVMYFEGNYSNDKLNSYKFLNKKGEVIAQSSSIKNEQLMKMFYPEGQLKSEGKITNKTKIGLWKFYDIHGNLTAEENYSNDGKLNGPSKRFYKNGQIEEDYTYKDGALDGYFKKYHINGKLSAEGRYDKDVEQGDWKRYYINGALEAENYYLDGDLKGYDVAYYPNGKKESEDLFEYEYYSGTTAFDTTGNILEDIKLDCGTGKMVLNYLNKKPKIDAVFKNGKYDGAFKRFFPNGKTKVECSYKFGEIHGLRRDYNFNNTLQFEGYYYYGERDSISKNFDEDGKLNHTSTYKKGSMEGEAVWFYPDGKKEITVNYKNDKRQGYYHYYAPDGVTLFRFNYDNGKLRSYSYLDKTGKMVEELPFTPETKLIKTFYQNGTVSAEFNYEKTAKHGISNYYYPSGKVMEKSNYFYGVLHGESKYFNENGTLKSEVTYFYDEKQGVEKEYDSMGKLVSETTYDAGIRNGPQKIYDPKTGKLVKTILYVYNDPYQ